MLETLFTLIFGSNNIKKQLTLKKSGKGQPPRGARRETLQSIGVG